MKKILVCFIVAALAGISVPASATPITYTQTVSISAPSNPATWFTSYGWTFYDSSILLPQIELTENQILTNVTLDVFVNLDTYFGMWNGSANWYPISLAEDLTVTAGELSATVAGTYNQHARPYRSDHQYMLINSDSATGPTDLTSFIGTGDMSLDLLGTGLLTSTTGGWIYLDYMAPYATIDVSLTYDVEPVPEPATMLLFGSGLVGLAGARRKMKA